MPNTNVAGGTPAAGTPATATPLAAGTPANATPPPQATTQRMEPLPTKRVRSGKLWALLGFALCVLGLGIVGWMYKSKLFGGDQASSAKNPGSQTLSANKRECGGTVIPDCTKVSLEQIESMGARFKSDVQKNKPSVSEQVFHCPAKVLFKPEGGWNHAPFNMCDCPCEDVTTVAGITK